MFDWIMAFKFNSLLALFVYWLPLGLCAYGYTVRTWKNYQADVKARSDKGYYRPTDKLGDLIGRGVISIIPVGNVMAACFDVAPEVFGDWFRLLGEIFDQPIVPDSDKYEQQRKENANG